MFLSLWLETFLKILEMSSKLTLTENTDWGTLSVRKKYTWLCPFICLLPVSSFYPLAECLERLPKPYTRQHTELWIQTAGAAADRQLLRTGREERQWEIKSESRESERASKREREMKSMLSERGAHTEGGRGNSYSNSTLLPSPLS